MPNKNPTVHGPLHRLVGPMQNENPLESMSIAITLSPHDWAGHHRLAWIYGIAVGWDDESLVDIAAKYKWTPETVSRLKLLRVKFEYLQTVGPPSAKITGSGDSHE